MPVAQDQGGVGAQEAKFQVGKIERAHGAAIGVIFFVAREDGVPAAGNAVASRKCKIGGMPVAGEECVDIAAIPSLLLGVEDGANGGDIGLMGGFSFGGFFSLFWWGGVL